MSNSGKWVTWVEGEQHVGHLSAGAPRLPGDGRGQQRQQVGVPQLRHHPDLHSPSDPFHARRADGMHTAGHEAAATVLKFEKLHVI